MLTERTNKPTMIPVMINTIPRLIDSVNFSLRKTIAMIAVNAGLIDATDADIEGPRRSRLIK